MYKILNSDWYMKIVFTVIAVALCVVAIQNVEFISKAEAYGSGTKVSVTNYETDLAQGATLYVHVKNADDMKCNCN
jgi:hypothetical protein